MAERLMAHKSSKVPSIYVYYVKLAFKYIYLLCKTRGGRAAHGTQVLKSPKYIYLLCKPHCKYIFLVDGVVAERLMAHTLTS